MVLKITILFLSIVFASSIFAQNQDSAKVILDKFYYSDYKFNKTVLDTQLTSFQLYNSFNKYYFKNISLGNIGLPILNINDINLFNTNEFVFANSLKDYIFNVDNVCIYRTNRRFTNVAFFNNGSKSKAENVVKIFHSQNLNPYLNISFKYNLINSLGYYKYQASKDNMLNFTAYYDKNRITSFFVVNYNALSYQNNGGIVNDTSVFESESYQSELVPVNLSTSVSSFKNFNVNFVSRYNFGYKIDTIISDSSIVSTLNRKSFLQYNFKFDKNKYLYNDVYNNFYSNYYYSDSVSFDSLTSFAMHNSVSLSNLINDSNKFAYALGFNFDINNFHFTNYSSLYSDAYLNIDAIYRLDEFSIFFKSKYFVDGFKNGDYNANLGLWIDKFYINIENIFQTPNYFMSNLFTNNFIWHNDFNKTLVVNLLGRYVADKNLSVDLKISAISNYIYFDTLCLPTQLNSSFLYFKFEIFKKFSFKRFRFITKNNLHYLPKNIDFSLPLFNTYNSLFYQRFLVKGVLNMQLGLDFFYNTSFKSYNYMPSLSVYYTSNDMTGGYPYFDAFVNLKLKRVNFTLKFVHVNQNLFGGKYVSIPYYPLIERGIRFGVSWNFYD